MQKFLVTDIVPEGFIERFEAAGFQVDHYPVASDALLETGIEQYTGIVINTAMHLDRDRLDKAVNLKYILRPGSGLDNVDVEYARSKGISLFSSPEANSVAVAEHAVAMLLSMMNRIPQAFEAVRELQWIRKPNMGIELKGKTVGIIGYGNTGSAFAKRVRCFECEVLVYDKYKSGFAEEGMEDSSMEEIFAKADILSLHLPLTAETHQLVSPDYISRFKKPFFLINTSRGAIVHTKSLLAALEKGQVLGASLDVLENESLETYTEDERKTLQGLLQHNVIITPHIAGWTQEARRKIFLVVQEKFFTFLAAMRKA